MHEIRRHFNKIASSYDYYKEKNWYYYDAIKALLKELIPNVRRKSVLDLGCGTGSILAFLQPKEGIGIDISEEMIKISKKKHPKYEFICDSAETVKIRKKMDYIIAIDIIEHLSSINKTIENISNNSGKDTTIIFSMINPLWEPILLIGERLGLKMPEGPHHRITFDKFNKILSKNDLRMIHKGYRLLIPLKMPLADTINSSFYKFPLIRRLGL